MDDTAGRDTADGVVVRAMRDADIPAAQRISFEALREAGQRYGWEMLPPDDATRARRERLHRHCLTTDPDGAFVADRDGQVVGVGLATRRGRLWYLSMLAVDTPLQGRGVGRRLLEATTGTLDDSGMICASDDPKALRRYRRAGFALVPTYEAVGALDRSRLPAGNDVRHADYSKHRDFVEDLAGAQRGAPHGPDIDYFAACGWPLLIVDDRGGRGYCVSRDHGPAVLAGTTPQAAGRLLWTSLAEAVTPKLEVSWLSHDQQWALDVALTAGLTLRPTGSRCLRGPTGPMSPYLPYGALG